MGDNSKIEWTDTTWNPVVGCTKVSAGCALCYWMVVHDRRHKAWMEGRWPTAPRQYHRPSSVVQLLEERLTQPLHWRKPRTVFVNSLSDLFHAEIPFEFIHRVFAVMMNTPRHTYQVLTKRPERMAEYAAWEMERARAEADYIPWPLPNVWLGTSVEDQKAADARIPHLIETPAAVRFLSCEPLLGPVDLAFACLPGIHWVICGGESWDGDPAHTPRPMHPNWARSLRDQCAAAGVPFFFKQWGDWIATDAVPFSHPARTLPCAATGYVDYSGRIWPVDCAPCSSFLVRRVGKKKAGRVLDGRVWDEMPATADISDGRERKGES